MWNGILNIYKEKGYTSHDVVAKLRGIVKQKKIGHTGTLDPDAEGVLPVCLGKATRLCDMLTDQSKTYEAVLLLGKTTDTQGYHGAGFGGAGDRASDRGRGLRLHCRVYRRICAASAYVFRLEGEWEEAL